MDRDVADAAHGQAMDEQARPQPAHSQLGQHALAPRAARVAHSGLDSRPARALTLRRASSEAPAHTAHGAYCDERDIELHGVDHAVPSTHTSTLRNSCRWASDRLVVAHRPPSRVLADVAAVVVGGRSRPGRSPSAPMDDPGCTTPRVPGGSSGWAPSAPAATAGRPTPARGLHRLRPLPRGQRRHAPHMRGVAGVAVVVAGRDLAA